MNKVDFIKAARALITTPENWTTGVFARNAALDEVDPTDETATCFCALGALAKVANDNHLNSHRIIQKMYAYTDTYGKSIASFNDVFGHAEVLRMFDAVTTELENADAPGNPQ